MPLALNKRALTATEVVANIAKLEGWKLSGDGTSVAIEKSFAFADYYQTLAFVNALAFVAHSQNHHPELVVGFGNCLVRYRTHDVGGITLADFDGATRVDALLA
jgi:4a-hydroxytetrahydrobiopterin dehydratase